MYHNVVFPNASIALPDLLGKLLHHGEEVNSRAGKVTELTHVGITLTKPWQRELLVPSRKPNLAAQIAETMWVIAGSNNVGWLSHYLPRAKDFSDDGQTWRAGYGTRLRKYPDHGNGAKVDQLANVIEELRAHPLSRQAVMSIWDPTEDWQPSKDIPCNNWLSWSSRLGKLDLHVAIRSNDAMWGWSGINAFEWSALLEIVAGMLGLGVGSLHFSTTSFHLYERHWPKAQRIVDGSSGGILEGALYSDSPRFDPSGVSDVEALDELVQKWFEVEKAIRHGDSSSEDVDSFPEPMFQSWLRVLQWWWSGQREWLEPLRGTRLQVAAHAAVQPRREDRTPTGKPSQGEPTQGQPSTFISQLQQLHLDKHAAYGDSWKKRGELMAIMANIARKVDRLGGETPDETSADTAGDLLVYLAKYRTWLSENGMKYKGWVLSSSSPIDANTMLGELDKTWGPAYGADIVVPLLEDRLRMLFERLEGLAVSGDPARAGLVDAMLPHAYSLARHLWEEANEAGSDEYRGADHE